MITAASFRRIRRSVFARTLVPRGFAESSSLYVCHTPAGQTHCAEIAAAKYGGSFTVDLGFHFSAVPLFADVPPVGRRTAACCFRLRFRKSDGNQFFGYGTSATEAESIALEIADRALTIFRDVDERWRDGSLLVRAVPPELLARDAAVFHDVLHATSMAEQDIASDSMLIRQLLPAWCPHILPTALSLAHVSLGQNNPHLAREYVEIANSARHTSAADAHILGILKQLQQDTS